MTGRDHLTGSSRRPRGPMVLLAVLVAALVGGGVVFGVAMLESRRHVDVWVSGMTDGEDGFTVDLPHERVSVEGARYVFDTDLTWEEIVEAVSEKYPDGVRTSEGYWAVAIDGTEFVVAPVHDGQGDYVAAGQYALLGDVDSGGELFAFPVTWWGRDVVAPGEAVDLGWTGDRWTEFYGLLSIEPEDGAYTVPTRGVGDVIVSVDPQGIAIVDPTSSSAGG